MASGQTRSLSTVRYPRSDRDQAGSSLQFFSSFTVYCWDWYLRYWIDGILRSCTSCSTQCQIYFLWHSRACFLAFGDPYVVELKKKRRT